MQICQDMIHVRTCASFVLTFHAQGVLLPACFCLLGVLLKFPSKLLQDKLSSLEGLILPLAASAQSVFGADLRTRRQGLFVRDL